MPPDSPALPSDQLVRIFYRHFLNRSPEASGLEGWRAAVDNSDDLSSVIKGFLSSPEYRLNFPVQSLGARALELLGRKPRIVDVGAQTLGPGSHIYDPLLKFCATDITGFDPLQDRLAEREQTEADPIHAMTLIPHALGDNGTHTLYINNHDATSSLYPLNAEGNEPFRLLAQLHTVRTETLETKRLDDVIPHEQVDYLKLDVQGGELLVLQNGTKVLEQTAVVHCETEFSPIYQGQPLFGDIAAFLATQGFYFLNFSFLGHYAHDNSANLHSNDRLMWADAVFLRDSQDPQIRAAQALCAAVIYHKTALAAHLLGE